jgi:flagellar basal-body rod modification protein FlgD
MDSTEFTNQLVQFSQVEQAINTNQKLDDMVQMQLGSLTSMSIGYVGLDVTYPSAELSYSGEGSTSITYALGEEAHTAKLNIRNDEGTLVYSADVETDTGSNHFVWDGSMTGGGTAPEGTYSFTIDAVNGAGETVDVSTAVTGRVRGVETQNGVPYLLVGDRAVPVGNVINAVQPKVAATDTGTDGTDTDGTDTDTGTDETDTGDDA